MMTHPGRLPLVLLFCLIGLLMGTVAYGQNFPVRASVTAVNASPYLEDYGRDGNLIVILTLVDAREEYNGLLRINIEGDGYRATTGDGVFMTPINLRRGQPLILRGSQLAPYFDLNNLNVEGFGVDGTVNNGGSLPDGPITICVEFYDLNRFNDPPVSNPACATRFVQQNYPPELVFPLTEIPAPPTELINFTWNPRHVPQPLDDEYELSVWEKVEGLTYDQIISSTAPLRSPITTTIPRYTYTNYDSPLEIGQEYIWRVRVSDRRNVRVFINDGISDFGEFQYGITPPEPTDICLGVDKLFAEGTNANSTAIRWTLQPQTSTQTQTQESSPIGGSRNRQRSSSSTGGGRVSVPPRVLSPIRFRLRYRLAAGGPWSEVYEHPPNQRTQFLEELEVGTAYEVELCALCEDGQETCETLMFTTLTLEEDCGDMTTPVTLPLSNAEMQLTWSDIWQASGYRLSWKMTRDANGNPPAQQTQQQTQRTTEGGPPGSSNNNGTRASAPSSSGGGSSSILAPGTTETTATGLVMNATYQFTFCKLCADGTEECYEWEVVWEGENAVCNPDYIPTPSIMFGSETPTSLGVSWTYAGGSAPAPGYELALISHPSGSPELGDTISLGLNETNRTISDLLAETSYDFTVCLTCLNGNLRCNTVTGTTISYVCPEQLDLESSVTAVPIAPDGVRVEWSALAGTADPAGWNVFVLSMAGDTLQRYPENGMTNPAGTTDHTFSGLTADTDYQIAICYDCEDEALPTCTLKTITVPGCEAVDLALTEGQVHFDFVEISWEDVGTPPYTVTFWEQGGDPLADPQEATETDFRLGGLSPLTTYDISVCFDCGATIVCDTITLTTIDVNCALAGDYEYDFECGINVSLQNPENQQLVETLAPGDSIWAGDFLVQVGEITGNTTFGGHGFTGIPYLSGAKLRLDFVDVQVNEDCRMVAGKMVIKSPLEAALEQLQQGLQDLQDILGEIDNFLGTLSATLGTISTVLDQIATAADVTDEANAVLEQLVTALDQVPYLPDSYVDAVEDAADCLKQAALTGDDEAVRACRDQLQAAIQAAQDYIDDLFDADFIVDFSPTVPANIYWGLDSQRYDLITEGYDPRTIGGTPYKVPWASTSTEEPAGVPFGAVRRDGGSMSPVNFIGSDTQTFPGWSTSGTNAMHGGLSADGDQQTKVVFAAHDNPDAEPGNDSIPPVKLAGQLNVVTYTPVRHTVHIIPVNTVALTQDAAAVQAAVNAIFRPSVAEFTVVIEPTLTVSEFDGQLSDIPESMLSNYTPEMNLLKGKVKAQGYYDGDDYYLIVVPSMQQPGRVGFMPRKRHFGFLSEAGLTSPALFNRTVAHELAHGAFHLQHISERFDDVSPGTTDNLMDNADGETLFKYQWDNVHDPESNFTLFDDEEEGESVAMVLTEEFNEDDFLTSLTYCDQSNPNSNWLTFNTDCPVFKVAPNAYFQFDNAQTAASYCYSLNGQDELEYISFGQNVFRVRFEKGIRVNPSDNTGVISDNNSVFITNVDPDKRAYKQVTVEGEPVTVIDRANSSTIDDSYQFIECSGQQVSHASNSGTGCSSSSCSSGILVNLSGYEIDSVDIVSILGLINDHYKDVKGSSKVLLSKVYVTVQGNSTQSDEVVSFLATQGDEDITLWIEVISNSGGIVGVSFDNTAFYLKDAKISNDPNIEDDHWFLFGLFNSAVNSISNALASIGDPVSYILQGLSKLIKSLTIDAKYYDPNHADYNPVIYYIFAAATGISGLTMLSSWTEGYITQILDDFGLSLNLGEGSFAQLQFALFAGAWNELVITIGDLPLFVDLIYKGAKGLGNISLDFLKGLIDPDYSFFDQYVPSDFSAFIDAGLDKISTISSTIWDQVKTMHSVDNPFEFAHTIGRDVIFVLSFFVGLGEVSAMVKGTKVAVFAARAGRATTNLFSKVVKSKLGLASMRGSRSVYTLLLATFLNTVPLSLASKVDNVVLDANKIVVEMTTSIPTSQVDDVFNGLVKEVAEETVEFGGETLTKVADDVAEVIPMKVADNTGTILSQQDILVDVVRYQNTQGVVKVMSLIGSTNTDPEDENTPSNCEVCIARTASVKALYEILCAKAGSSVFSTRAINKICSASVLSGNLTAAGQYLNSTAITSSELISFLRAVDAPPVQTAVAGNLSQYDLELVKAWEVLFAPNSTFSKNLSRNITAVQYFSSNSTEMGQSATTISSELRANANYPLLEVQNTSHQRLITLLSRPSANSSNKGLLVAKNNVGTYKMNVITRAYNANANSYSVQRSTAGYITPTFVGTTYLHPLNEGHVIRITMTGNRGTDDTRANQALRAIHPTWTNHSGTNYTWHHLDDFNPTNFTCTMQLVQSDHHGGQGVSGMAHSGSVKQFQAYFETLANAVAAGMSGFYQTKPECDD